MEKFEIELTEENVKKTITEDYLDNNKKLCDLSRLVNEIDTNMTICIDGDWGCGKTFFVNQFRYIIEKAEEYENLNLSKEILPVLKNIKENNVVVYYDAWKNDNHPDVFQSIIYNILNEFPKYKDIVTDFSEVKKMFNNIGKNVLNAITFGIISQDIIDIDKISTYEDLADKIVTVEEKAKKFKQLLKEILGNKRMILIVDELDRCNPMFATKMLETIKHFYDISNITIIIVANNKELSHTIKKQYGSEFDAYGYLNKFYDFIITLDNSKNVEYAQKVLKFRSSTYLPHDVSYVMFKKYGFSYRECNRFRTMYKMVEKHIEIQQHMIFDEVNYRICFDIILPIILAFKIKDIDSYIECLNTDKTDAIREALMYLKEEFKKIHGSWLKELAQTDEDDEIKVMIDKYLKFRKEGIYQKLFSNCIRMTI